MMVYAIIDIKKGNRDCAYLSSNCPLILTAINFVHVNGRSLYTDWRTVVVVGRKCHKPCKKGGKLSGRENV